MSIDVNKIKNKEDKPLITDSIKLCESSFYRASFIMAWLACAESLKRRFHELGKRDYKIGGLYRKINESEKQHKSVDKEIIDGAFEFNLISDTEKEKLSYFLKMRNIYSHPYEDSPSKTDCHQIIESVIDIVLSRPVLLKEGGISFILKRLTEEKSFLNDLEEEIESYASEIIPLIDDKKYSFFCEKYLKFLEKMTKDQYSDILYKRGIYFLRKFIKQIGVKNIWNNEDFDNILYDYRNASLNVFATVGIFKNLSPKIQSIIINRLQEDLDENLFLIGYLDKMFIQSLLPQRQSEIYLRKIQELSWDKLNALNLSMRSMYGRIIRDLKRHDWYSQNPACRYIKNYFPFFMETDLIDAELIELGRNILQAYDGESTGAGELLDDLSKTKKYPYPLIQGILEECFYDNDKKVRLKISNPQLISSIIDANLSKENQEKILFKISENIQNSEIKRSWSWEQYDKIPDSGLLGEIKKVLWNHHPVFPF